MVLCLLLLSCLVCRCLSALSMLLCMFLLFLAVLLVLLIVSVLFFFLQGLVLSAQFLCRPIWLQSVVLLWVLLILCSIWVFCVVDSFSAAGVSVGAPHFLLIGGTAPIPLHAPVSLHSLLCIPLVHSPHCVHIQSGRQYIPPP